MSLKGHIREIVLGAVLLVIVFWYFSPSAPPPAEEGEQDEAKTEDLLLEAIRRIRGAGEVAEMIRNVDSYDGGGRNLFDYGVIKPPPPSQEELDRLAAERAAREEAERLKREEAERLRAEAQRRLEEQARLAARNATPPPPAAPAKPVPPNVNVKFIGVIGDPEDKIAIFLDKDDFILAKEGDTVKDDFVVQQISYDTLRMGFTDPRFEGESRILPMGEK